MGNREGCIGKVALGECYLSIAEGLGVLHWRVALGGLRWWVASVGLRWRRIGRRRGKEEGGGAARENKKTTNIGSGIKPLGNNISQVARPSGWIVA